MDCADDSNDSAWLTTIFMMQETSSPQYLAESSARIDEEIGSVAERNLVKNKLILVLSVGVTM